MKLDRQNLLMHSPVPREYQVQMQGYRGVQDSVDHMVKFGLEGQTHPVVRQYSAEVIRQVYPRDYLSELAAIYYDVCRRIRYTRDPLNKEFIHHPVVVLQQKQGDCDDMALLIRAAMGATSASIGNMVQYVVVGFVPNVPEPSRYTHVFARAQAPDGRWIVLDPVAGPNTRQMIGRVVHFRAFDTDGSPTGRT